jgi:hypothetical protein
MAKRKRKQSKRVCLRCDREFLSDGIYNRICPNCREANANCAYPDPASDSSSNNSHHRRIHD